LSGCEEILATLPEFLKTALAMAPGSTERASWRAQIEEWKLQWPDTAELNGVPGINPNMLMHQLSVASPSAGAYVIDVGQHQMWAAQSLDIGPDQRFLTSGGMGSMGFALPAAIGAAFSTDRPVVVVAGDGGFQCNIQELQTVVRNRLPIKIVIINNLCHGMVRQFQESYFDARYQSTLWGYSSPDFERVAAGYGIASRTAANPEDVDAALRWLWEDPGQPALLQVAVDTYANVYPKIAFGRPITEMEPFAKPIEMEST
jgi:acetolactate synthase-1/2/3 large subunit